MNLFESILKNASPIQNPVENFMSGFTPSKPTPQQSPQSKPSFIQQVNAGEPLVSDKEIEEMIKQGASDKEIEMIVSELEKERSSPQQSQQSEKSFLQKASSFLDTGGDAIMNLVGGAVEQTPKVLGNIYAESSKAGAYTPMAMASAAIRAPFSEKTYGQLREEQKQAGQWAKGAGEQGAEFVQKYGSYNPESAGASVGRIGTNVLSTFVGPGKVFKTAEKASLAIKALAGLANTSIEGTTAAVTNYVATEGRLPTAKEVAEFIALQGGIKTIGNIAGQVKKLPSAKLIPTTITEAGKDIRKGIDIGEAISKTGISFTKGQLIRKIEKVTRFLSGKVDDSINAAIKKTGPNNITMSSITKGLKEDILKDATIKAQLKGTPIQMKQIEETIDETITAYKKLYGAKKFDLNAQQQLKKDIYTGLENVFNKNFQTTGKITAQQATERQIARKLRENIETKVPEVIELNKQLAPYLEAGKRLSAKGGYSGYLTDILAGGFAGGTPGGIIEDPVGYAKNFLLGVVAKRTGTSTFAKTSASTIAANIEKAFKNPVFQKAILDQYRQLNSNQ